MICCGHKGLHAKVRKYLREFKAMSYSRDGIYSFSAAEDAYAFFCRAEKYLVECQYVPNAFFKENELDFGLHFDLVYEWNKVFNAKSCPYLSIRGIQEKRSPLGYEVWMKRARRLIKERKKHYASEYFARLIAYWMYEGWFVNQDDLYSPYGDLEMMALKIWEKPWLQEYNKTKYGAKDEEA